MIDNGAAGAAAAGAWTRGAGDADSTNDNRTDNHIGSFSLSEVGTTVGAGFSRRLHASG